MDKEITINSTDEERTAILSKKDLTVVQWDKKHGFRQTDPQESIAHRKHLQCVPPTIGRDNNGCCDRIHCRFVYWLCV